MKKFLDKAITIYQHTFSDLLFFLFGKGCRFEPVCSEYARQAIDIHGPSVGTFLAVRRLLKCRPLGGSGFDPVPPKIK
jgi:putative membrane protein insertion efficiency factor